MTVVPTIEVAAGVLRDTTGRVLVARRAPNAHQGGLWEFPGGKREPGEGRRQALDRELAEELGIRVTRARPLIRLAHDYGDRKVVLDTWLVEGWQGEPRGREGQPLRWVSRSELARLPMPAADRPILRALALPPLLAITPPLADDATVLAGLEPTLARGIRLIQLRLPGLAPVRRRRLARICAERCRAAGARLLLNAPPAEARAVGAHGVHLSSRRLAALRHPEVLDGLLVGASCHDAAGLRRALAIGADFALLSPVLPTASHPHARPLGWPGFAALVDELPLPVYALGGLDAGRLDQAWAHGAQGVAGIRGLWG